LGEGARLALAGTEGRVELAPQAVVLGLQAIDPPLEGLTVGTPDRFHARIIGSSLRCSGRGGSRRMDQVELGALIKYLCSSCRFQSLAFCLSCRFHSRFLCRS